VFYKKKGAVNGIPYEEERFQVATKAMDYKLALQEVHTEVFRPARKHGYSNPKIQDLLTDSGEDLIYELEQLFFKIINEHNVSM